MRTKMLSRADRFAACIVALASVLLCAGVRYAFHRPAHAALTVVSTERAYMP